MFNKPSWFSKSSNSKRQDFSSGLSRSHKPPSTLAITVFSKRLLLIWRAIAAGVVSQDFPATIEPLGKVTVISSRGFTTENVNQRRVPRRIDAAVTCIQETSASYSDFNLSNNWILWGINSGIGSSWETKLTNIFFCNLEKL